MRAFNAKQRRFLDSSIGGFTSVAECERDERGRFAPRRAHSRADDESQQKTWWMAL
jgi:hypothetical protein